MPRAGEFAPWYLAGAASFFMAKPSYHGKIKMQLVVVVVNGVLG
jgi:hypothetical protein